MKKWILAVFVIGLASMVSCSSKDNKGMEGNKNEKKKKSADVENALRIPSLRTAFALLAIAPLQKNRHKEDVKKKLEVSN